MRGIYENGKLVAALVDAKLFARVRRARKRLDDLSKRMLQAYANISAEEGLAEIDAATTAERKQR